MQKFAQNTELDPKDRALRQEKKAWNVLVSSVINDLINFKKLMNGKENSFVRSPSRIHEPIPGNPVDILAVISQDFQEIMEKGNKIIEDQLEYSKTRRKKQPKNIIVQNPAIQAPVSTPDTLSQQLSASIESYELISLASNPFSRFVSRLKGPWFGSSPEVRARKYRLGMLRSAAQLEDQLKAFEASILGTSSESIFVASKLFQQIGNHLIYLNDTLQALQALNTPILPESTNKDSIINNSSVLDEVNKFIVDFRNNWINFPQTDDNITAKMVDLVRKFRLIKENEQGLSKDELLNAQLALAPEIIKIYKDAVKYQQEKNNSTLSTLEEILKENLQKNAFFQTKLEKLAQKILKKYLGKAVHNINPFDKTSPIRLDVNKVSEEMRKTLNDLMNKLENNANVEEIAPALQELAKQYASIKMLMKPLESTIKNKIFDDTFIKMLDKNMLPDYGTNLSDKQKQHLQRMLETRKFRDFTNFYDKS